MKRLAHHLLAAAAALAVTSLLTLCPPALAGGLWEGLPQAGITANSQCINTINGVCAQFAPAGPTSLTGNETLPADTNLSGGRSPQTAKYPFVQFGAGATQYSAPLTGASITIAATTSNVIVDPAGTIAALTLVFPAASALVDGQQLRLCGTQIVTTLTITDGAGATVQNKPTAMLVPVTTGAASCVEWVYIQSQLKWFRVQ